MSDTVFTLDLITKNTFTESSLKEVKEKIKNLNNPILFDIAESIELARNSKIEIYLEAIPCDFEEAEELVDFVSEIESILGRFEDKSVIEMIFEFPHKVKTWEKQGYEWSLILEEEDDYYDKKNSWEEWEEWEEDE
jgi:hypothetical protein